MHGVGSATVYVMYVSLIQRNLFNCNTDTVTVAFLTTNISPLHHQFPSAGTHTQPDNDNLTIILSRIGFDIVLTFR